MLGEHRTQQRQEGGLRPLCTASPASGQGPLHQTAQSGQLQGSQRLPWGMGAHAPGGGACLSIPTSSISLIHRSMPSKDQRLVMSYTSRIPCTENGALRGPLDGRGLAQARPRQLSPSTGRIRALGDQCHVDPTGCLTGGGNCTLSLSLAFKGALCPGLSQPHPDHAQGLWHWMPCPWGLDWGRTGIVSISFLQAHCIPLRSLRSHSIQDRCTRDGSVGLCPPHCPLCTLPGGTGAASGGRPHKPGGAGSVVGLAHRIP